MNCNEPVVMNYYMQLCSLLEKLEDVCRSTKTQRYSDDQFFQLAHDVLFREVHISAATL